MPGLRRNADFMRLWTAQAISAYGSRITRTALPIIAVKTLGVSESIVGTLAALQLAPGVVLAVFSGGFVDRSHKRRILIGTDLFRAAVVASLTFAWALGALSMVHVIIVGSLVGAAGALFHIADVAFLPSLVEKAQLAEGNAKLETTDAIAEITGPATGGALIAALGAPLAVAIDAASYLWSALWLGRIRTVETPQPLEPSTGLGSQTTQDLRVGMRAVFGHPHVRPLVLSQMAAMIAGGFFSGLYGLFCLRELELSEATFGLVIAVGGVGALIGAAISRPLAKAIGVGRTLILTSAFSMASMLLIPLAGGSRVMMFGFLAAHQLISDGLWVSYVIQAVTLRQTVLPKAILGRANAAIYVCTMTLLPINALIAGVLAQLTSIRFAVWVGVSFGLVAPLFLLPLRKLRGMPPAAE